MRVVVNEKKVRRSRRIAQYSFFATLGLLIAGLFVTNAAPANPVLLLAPLIVLPIAIGATFYSVRMANLWLREPRPEKVFAEGLKGLSARSVLYHYVFPARHVLITPQGVFTFTMRQQDGKFVFDDGKWTKQGNILSQFMTIFRQDSIGRPDVDAQREAAEVQKFINQVAPDSGVIVEPVIIFSSPLAEVEVGESEEMPVIYGDNKRKPNLKIFSRDLKKRQDTPSLSDEQIAALESAAGLEPETAA